MPMTHKEILQDLQLRQTSTRWGIGTAKQYLESLESNLPPGTSSQSWQQAIKDAESKLVYCDDQMIIEDTKSKSVQVEGACLVFDCVLTSTRKDRDGDILEAKGASVDPAMPLLWQHSPAEPVGKLIDVPFRNSKRVLARFAVIDNEFGRDVAQLIEFGALRISHGFKPTKFTKLEPKDKDDNEDAAKLGWHIEEFDVMEGSVVSVPANTDAIITAFSRGKLHCPYVKSWAESYNNDRPATSKGITLPDNDKVVISKDGVKSIKIEFSSKDQDQDQDQSQDNQDKISKTIVPFEDTLAAEQDRQWDADAAVQRLREWAKSGDEIDLSKSSDRDKYRRGFGFVRDDGTKLGDYILPHHDIIDNELHVVFRGMAAVVAVVNGARGGVNVSDDDREKIYSHVAKHYKSKFPDASIPEFQRAVTDPQDESTTDNDTKSIADDLGQSITLLDETLAMDLPSEAKQRISKARQLIKAIARKLPEEGGEGGEGGENNQSSRSIESIAKELLSIAVATDDLAGIKSTIETISAIIEASEIDAGWESFGESFCECCTDGV